MNLLELLPKLLDGLTVSALMWALTLLIGYPLGLLLSLVQRTPSKAFSAIVFVVVELGRGAPVLVVLYLVYFGLPNVGVLLPAIPAAVIAFAITTAAYSSEIFRGALSSIPRGQLEAARVLGFSPAQQVVSILLPQALRVALPALIGFAITVFQGTALAYAISVPELLGRAYNEANISFRYVEVLAVAGAVYLVVSLVGTWVADRIERRMNKAFART
jgi:amine acid ABC transporter, permease protein, 3-TM region, His/Glu/Gln/Arg/opine family